MQTSFGALMVIVAVAATPVVGAEARAEEVDDLAVDMLFGISQSVSLLALKHGVEQERVEQAIHWYLYHWSPRYRRARGEEWPGFIDEGYRGHAAAFIARCRERYGDEAGSIGALLVDYVQMAGGRPPAAE